MENGSTTRLYEAFLNQQEVTIDYLKEIGFTTADILSLFESQTLQRGKDKGFVSIDPKQLFRYGIVLKGLKRYERASVCFHKCYELDPMNQGVCFQLFLESIGNLDYEKAVDYFRCFYDPSNKKYRANNFVYLYLLSMLTNLPESLKCLAQSLKKTDLEVHTSSDGVKHVDFQNKIRGAIFDQKWKYALEQLNDFIEMQGVSMVSDILMKRLLVEVVQQQETVKDKILGWIREDQMEEIVLYLEKIQCDHCLSKEEWYVLSVTMDLLTIRKTQIIPEKGMVKERKVFAAIDAQDYELALSLKKKGNRQHYALMMDNPLYLLLKEIKREIAGIRKQEDCCFFVDLEGKMVLDHPDQKFVRTRKE